MNHPLRENLEVYADQASEWIRSRSASAFFAAQMKIGVIPAPAGSHRPPRRGLCSKS